MNSNNKNKNEFEELVRKRLKNHEMTPDDGLWQQIEDSLDMQKTGSKIALWQWIAGAAAIIFFGIISTLFITKEIDYSLEAANEIKQENLYQSPLKPLEFEDEKKIERIEEIEPKKISEIIDANAVNSNILAKIDKETDKKIDKESYEKNLKKNHKELNKTKDDEKLTSSDMVDEIADKIDADLAEKLIAFAKAADLQIDLPNQGQKKGGQPRGLSLALAYGRSGITNGNGLNSTDPYNLKLMNSPSMSPSACERELEDAYNYNRDNADSENINYNIPIVASIYLRKHLSSLWALETGLTYTYLSSQSYYMNAIQSSESEKLKIHYLGIPLKLVYSFFNKDELSMYGSTGLVIEKALAANSEIITLPESTNTSFNISELQFSFVGSLGLNYKLVDRLGVFIEPSVAYYFDDRSGISTIRKKSPLNFQLQAGLRLTY